MTIGKEGLELFSNIRELIGHSHSSEMATKYNAGKFNYGNTCRLMHDYLRINATEEEIRELYPKGL